MIPKNRKADRRVYCLMSRADVLVRCSTPGNYILSSGYGPNLYGPGVDLNNEFMNKGAHLIGRSGSSSVFRMCLGIQKDLRVPVGPLGVSL